MNKSEQINELVGALAKAQAGIGATEKNRSVSVTMKSGGAYSFKYTTLDYIIEHVRAGLTANGLWFTQTLEQADSKYRLVTTLMHSSGQWLSSETPLMIDGGNNQAFGSALTYMRRYALTAMLGIASEDDDDGNASDGNEMRDNREKSNGKPQATTQSRKHEAAGIGDAREWANSATQALPRIKTVEALAAWREKHGPTIDKLADVVPDEYAALMSKIERRSDDLNALVAG